MDSVIAAAAQALTAGNPIGALKRVALREDAPALALRGIAMAQLGDLDRARDLLKKARRAFGVKEAVARARCVVAEAEVALASRDLTWPDETLEEARGVLEAGGDARNAAHARHLKARRLLLIGRLDEAEAALAAVNPKPFPPASRAVYELAKAGVAMRRLRSWEAREALERAGRAARAAGIPALMEEVKTARRELDMPVARIVAKGEEQLVRLDVVEILLRSGEVVVDACRMTVRCKETVVALARRPVLFALARALGEAWPEEASREELVARAFRAKQADESHRARLRVEMGRLRASLKELAEVKATRGGFVLTPLRGRRVMVLAPPVEDENAAVLAFLADGEAWSSSALATALGASQRTVQRALDALQAAGKAQAFGKGRAQQWTSPPLPGFTTTLLLPGPLPGN